MYLQSIYLQKYLKMKQLSKIEEVALLEQLRTSESYFADTFTTNDIKQMQDNIKNDFPLLHCTNILQLKDFQKKLIVVVLQNYKQQILTMSKLLLTDAQMKANQGIAINIDLIIKILESA